MEPALTKKLFNVGFVDIEVVERRGVSLDDLTRYPLFAPDFIDFLRRVTGESRHSELVFSIVVTARKPAPLAARETAAESHPD
ncbi:MAG: hypothetical protein AB7O37_11150 [Vicinamibacteria bacterium]